MAVTSTQGNQKRELASLIGNIIARNHRLEYLIYLKTMKLLINLNGREQSPYLPLPKIRHSLSSMKIDRPTANHLLRQLRECGFVSYVPGHGYKLNLTSFSFRVSRTGLEIPGALVQSKMLLWFQ